MRHFASAGADDEVTPLTGNDQRTCGTTSSGLTRVLVLLLQTHALTAAGQLTTSTLAARVVFFSTLLLQRNPT